MSSLEHRDGRHQAIIVMVATPAAAKFMRLKTPRSAMVFGGLAGTVSGVSAGLAATDRKLVPTARSSRRFTPASAACSCHRFFSHSQSHCRTLNMPELPLIAGPFTRRLCRFPHRDDRAHLPGSARPLRDARSGVAW